MKKINLLNKKIIKENLASFENGLPHTKDEGRNPLARYASFDYCFNYFQSFKNKKEIAYRNNIQNSCLHLAFYLASWGMLRGSSFLLQKSIKFYEPLIRYISKQDNNFWNIDVPSYSEENIENIINCAKNIKSILERNIGDINIKNNVSDTQITKIMLGVFGNVPAFDSYFKSGSGLCTFNRHALEEIKFFYDKNEYSKLIFNESINTRTFDYNSGKTSNRSYTIAKIIDMIFFAEGLKTS